MKVLVYGVLMLFAVSSVNKCDKGIEGRTVSLNEQFELEVEKTVVVKSEKFGLTFTRLQESRCPKGTSCIRAGEARVNLQVTNSEGNTETLVLESKGNCERQDGSCGETKKVLGYSIQLINVNPYPGTADKSEKSRVVLSVTK